MLCAETNTGPAKRWTSSRFFTPCLHDGSRWVEVMGWPWGLFVWPTAPDHTLGPSHSAIQPTVPEHYYFQLSLWQINWFSNSIVAMLCALLSSSSSIMEGSKIPGYLVNCHCADHMTTCTCQLKKSPPNEPTVDPLLNVNKNTYWVRRESRSWSRCEPKSLFVTL